MLELLARQKLAWQLGEKSFLDEESGVTFDAATATEEDMLGLAWDHYTAKAPWHDWTEKNLSRCRSLVRKARTFNGGAFDPHKRTVVKPEQYFDLVFDRPWATYRYVLPDGEVVSGQWGLKGTMDLLVEIDDEPGVFELIDWKTGARKDWATGEEKDYKKLCHDPQLRMYHWALCQLYPEVEEFLVTIVFIDAGGPYSIPLTRADLPETEMLLQRRFEAIRATQIPRMKSKTGKHFWCEKICHYGKTIQEGTEQSICQYHRQELIQLGMERATLKHAPNKPWLKYGSGGGVENRDERMKKND